MQDDVTPNKLPPLSAPAALLRALLRSLPGGAVCARCIDKRLSLEAYEMLKAEHELILQEQVVADARGACSICEQQTRVVRLRSDPFDLAAG